MVPSTSDCSEGRGGPILITTKASPTSKSLRISNKLKHHRRPLGLLVLVVASLLVDRRQIRNSFASTSSFTTKEYHAFLLDSPQQVIMKPEANTSREAIPTRMPTNAATNTTTSSIANNSIDAMAIVAPFPEEQPLLNCSDIEQLEIVRTIGEGKQKIAYEVKLPGGGRAVAKRCLSAYCVKDEHLHREAMILKNLQSQYGSAHTMLFFGDCNGTSWNHTAMKLRRSNVMPLAANFSTGYTSVMELGTPLMPTWDTLTSWEQQHCFARHYTHQDVEGFRTMARQYANYSYSGPLIMAKPGYPTDNIFPVQYLLTRAGMRHCDLDQLYECPNCTFAEALETNCAVLRALTNLQNMSCSSSSSDTNMSEEHNDDYGGNISDHNHINITEATRHCSNVSLKI